MPSTYNGIGTHYYGKRNIQTRLGECRSCGRNVQLKSYDTRLWFVVFFIPIIPLGRKRIVDYCTACTRHYAVKLDKWETARQLEISGSMERFRANPSVDAAIEVHRQLLEYHQIAEAGEFQKLMLTQFPENAKVFAYLGAAQEHLGKQKEAADLFGQALKLRPDLPEARIGVAQGQIRAGRLDEARVLLDFLEKPGASQLYTLAPLETLARAYQAAGHHAEALDLFGKIVEGLPKVTEHAGFRKTVKISEKALGRTTSILPKQKFSWKRFFTGGSTRPQRVAGVRALVVIGVIVVLVLLGFVISNEYTRRHRKLYIVNAFSTPATVEIAGVESLKNVRGARSINIPEGHFHASISGPVKEEMDFDVRDTYFNRSLGDSLWLINVGGGALLKVTAATYSEHPQPATTTFYTGKSFEHFQTITHPFQTLPSSVQIDSGGSKTLVGLEIFRGDAVDAFDYYMDKRKVSTALEFGENWLRVHPEDENVLQLYVSAAANADSNRLDRLLLSGLTNRPVRIQWHRDYQEMHKRAAERPELITRYDEMLRGEPQSSALLYLRGRLVPDRVSARNYYSNAIAADAKNPFPCYALAFDCAAAGDWPAAQPLLARAAALNHQDLGIVNLNFLTRLALGEAPDIEKEAREKLKREPLDYSAELELLNALAAQGKNSEVTNAAGEFVARCRTQYGTKGTQIAQLIQYHGFYLAEDFAQLNALTVSDTSPGGQAWRMIALIEQGQPDEAAKVLSSNKKEEDDDSLLFALAVASRLNGDETAAAQWEARGIEVLRQGGTDDVEIANILNRGTPPTLAEAREMTIAPQRKALVIAMLAQQYPQARTELMGLARQLNVGREFPHHLVGWVTKTP